MLQKYIIDLLSGDISFMAKLDFIKQEAFCIELRNHQLRDEILNKIFDLLSKAYPMYAFKVVYDSPSYEEFCKRYLDSDLSVMKDTRFFHNFLGSSSWSLDYVEDNMDRIIAANYDNIFSISRYAFYNNRTDWIERLAKHDDLKIRQNFMQVVIEDFPYYFYQTFTDIEESITKKDEQGNIVDKFDEEYLSKIAVLVVRNLNDTELFLKIKEFILSNYAKNTLASTIDLTGLNENDENLQKLLIEDIDRLFITSSDYKWQLYQYYREYLSEEIAIPFGNKIELFIDIYGYEVMESISKGCLLDEFIEFGSRYLQMSTGSKCVMEAGVGTCSFAYRIGDYLIKFADNKYSREEELCPNIYLIAKNYEQVIKRNAKGVVTGAVEVQKFFSRRVLASQKELLDKWTKALAEAGYELKDKLVDGLGGTNCYYLDDYHDADTDDPESLPEWFKKDPIVLVDRDLVYKLEHK